MMNQLGERLDIFKSSLCKDGICLLHQIEFSLYRGSTGDMLKPGLLCIVLVYVYTTAVH